MRYHLILLALCLMVSGCSTVPQVSNERLAPPGPCEVVLSFENLTPSSPISIRVLLLDIQNTGHMVLYSGSYKTKTSEFTYLARINMDYSPERFALFLAALSPAPGTTPPLAVMYDGRLVNETQDGVPDSLKTYLTDLRQALDKQGLKLNLEEIPRLELDTIEVIRS